MVSKRKHRKKPNCLSPRPRHTPRFHLPGVMSKQKTQQSHPLPPVMAEGAAACPGRQRRRGRTSWCSRRRSSAPWTATSRRSTTTSRQRDSAPAASPMSLSRPWASPTVFTVSSSPAAPISGGLPSRIQMRRSSI
ncbi:hypothetical protein ACQJBY_068503 [Aegilops geniculata]